MLSAPVFRASSGSSFHPSPREPSPWLGAIKTFAIRFIPINSPKVRCGFFGSLHSFNHQGSRKSRSSTNPKSVCTPNSWPFSSTSCAMLVHAHKSSSRHMPIASFAFWSPTKSWLWMSTKKDGQKPRGAISSTLKNGLASTLSINSGRWEKWEHGPNEEISFGKEKARGTLVIFDARGKLAQQKIRQEDTFTKKGRKVRVIWA